MEGIHKEILDDAQTLNNTFNGLIEALSEEERQIVTDLMTSNEFASGENRFAGEKVRTLIEKLQVLMQRVQQGGGIIDRRLKDIAQIAAVLEVQFDVRAHVYRTDRISPVPPSRN